MYSEHTLMYNSLVNTIEAQNGTDLKVIYIKHFSQIIGEGLGDSILYSLVYWHLLIMSGKNWAPTKLRHTMEPLRVPNKNIQ